MAGNNGGGGSSITSELKGLNLEDFCRMPSTPPVSAPQSVVGCKSLGAIPKTQRQPTAQAPPPPPPAVAVAAEEEEEEEAAAADEVTASPGLGKRRKNRKQRRRRTVPAADAKAEKQSAGKTLVGAAAAAGLFQADRRVPDFNFPELDKLCKMVTPETALLLSVEEAEAPEEEEEEEGKKRVPEPQSQGGPRPVNSKKAGARRKRGGKRKKQKSPDPAAAKGAENKENSCGSVKFEAAKSSDDDSAAEDSSPKFNWQNVTKNGMIKKCILVDGVSEGGRPRSGDTVLVKSQGKLKEGTIVDDYPMLVFNVGEHEVIDGLDLAVQSMYKVRRQLLQVVSKLYALFVSPFSSTLIFKPPAKPDHYHIV